MHPNIRMVRKKLAIIKEWKMTNNLARIQVQYIQYCMMPTCILILFQW